MRLKIEALAKAGAGETSSPVAGPALCRDQSALRRNISHEGPTGPVAARRQLPSNRSSSLAAQATSAPRAREHFPREKGSADPLLAARRRRSRKNRIFRCRAGLGYIKNSLSAHSHAGSGKCAPQAEDGSPKEQGGGRNLRLHRARDALIPLYGRRLDPGGGLIPHSAPAGCARYAAPHGFARPHR